MDIELAMVLESVSRAGLRKLLSAWKETDFLGTGCIKWWCMCIMQAGFETLVEAGYDPRNAYFDVFMK